MPAQNQGDRETVTAPSSSKSDFVLASKGGVGKTVVARLIAEYRKNSGEPVFIADTDLRDGGLISVTSLGAEHFPAMEDDDTMNGKALDACFDRIITEDVKAVVDNGSPSFSPMCNYFRETGLFELLHDQGKLVTVHVPLAASDIGDTASAFEWMLEMFPATVRFVPWVNEHFGELTIEGTSFYTKYHKRFAGVVRLRRFNPKLGGAVFSQMLAEKLTFGDVAADTSGKFGGMAKLHLANVWKVIEPQLAKVM